MTPQPDNDPDFAILAQSAATLALRYVAGDDDPWAGSPFEWILKTPSRSKGAIGELLVEGWAAHRGFTVRRSPSSEADRVINGHRIEIKMSTLWKSGGYKFQQIRDQAYDYCLCLGLSPFEVHAWLLPKGLLHEYAIGHMGQHTGAAGSDTAWLGFPADAPYDWMKPYGYRLDDVAFLLNEAGRGTH